jgi:hypothetical protein
MLTSDVTRNVTLLLSACEPVSLSAACTRDEIRATNDEIRETDRASVSAIRDTLHEIRDTFSHIMESNMDIRAWIALAALAGTGCAGGQQSADTAPVSPQQEAARQSTAYRTQAISLREMADRRQLEADLLAREVGPNDPSVDKKTSLGG